MLVLGPVNTLQNWKAELERWIPDGGRLPYNKLMSVFILDEAGRTNKLRCEALQRWFKEGGVMCMGYEMCVLVACCLWRACSRSCFLSSVPRALFASGAHARWRRVLGR